MKKLLLFIGIIPFIVLGCSSQPPREKLIGKYCFNRNNNRDSIFIFEDNKYKHQYINSDGKLFFTEGEWEYDSLSSEILFKDFAFLNEEGADNLPRGNWFSKVDLVDDEIRLMYSAENNIYFLKNNQLKAILITETNKKFSGSGNQNKELNLTGRENILKLSYDFYKEADELIIYDQKERELYRTGMRATTKTDTATVNLSGVTKLVFKIKGNDTTSQWKFSVEVK